MSLDDVQVDFVPETIFDGDEEEGDEKENISMENVRKRRIECFDAADVDVDEKVLKIDETLFSPQLSPMEEDNDEMNDAFGLMNSIADGGYFTRTLNTDFGDDFIAVESPSGERFFCYYKRAAFERESNLLHHLSSDGSGGGLMENFAAVKLEALSLKENTFRPVSDELNNGRLAATKTSALWTKKYLPTSYYQLLSDEGLNRLVMKWFKLWDYKVFRRRSTANRLKSEMQKIVDQKQSKFKRKMKTNKEIEDELEIDPVTKLPKQVILMLCGAPGVGKTTLAHVIARHCGYHVVELNASDDRSVEVFRSAISNSTQSTMHNKPMCLILDEIDGATKAAVNVLLESIKGGGAASKRSMKSGVAIQRPIVCICNDSYANCVRDLRQHALVIEVNPPLSSTLSSRITQICAYEQIKLDLPCIQYICEKSGYDVRQCLNALQMLDKQQSNREISLDSLKDCSFFEKDEEKSLFSIWTRIFYRGRKMNDNSSEKEVIASIVNDINKSDTTRLLAGVFGNYLHLATVRDDRMRSVALSSDLMCLGDIFVHRVHSQQQWHFMSNIAYLMAFFRCLFATQNSKPRIEFPWYENEMRSALAKNEATVSQFVSCLAPRVRVFASSIRSIVLDLFPNLLEIIQPMNLKSSNTQLYTNKENIALKQATNVYLQFGLGYVSNVSGDGVVRLLLDPPIDQIANFSNRSLRLSSALRQVVSKQIEVERVRSLNSSNFTSTTVLPKSAQAVICEAATPNLDNDAQKSRKVAFSFIVDNGPPKSSEPTGNARLLNRKLWFSYKSGYSNAVRRKVKISNFLLEKRS